MRKVLTALLAVVFAAGLLVAQEKMEKKKSDERKISGDIMALDEAKSTITIKKGNEMSVVHYNDATKWTKQEKDKVVDINRSEFKVGERVICMAHSDDKGQWWARRIDLRRPK